MTKKTRPSRPPQNPSRFRPVILTVGVVGLILAVVFLMWATVGIRSVRGALVAETERQSLALLRSLMLASQYSLATGTLIEQLERQTLAERAHGLLERAQPPQFDENYLSSFCATLEVDGISIWIGDTVVAFPGDLNRALSSQNGLAVSNRQPDEASALTVADTTTDIVWTGIGFLTERGPAAVWKVGASASSPSAIRGIGELIQEIGRQSGINYIILQAPDGIVFASRPLKPILKLAADSFLVRVLETDRPATREIVLEGIPVMEAAAPFLSTDMPSGMFRVGLSLDAVNDAVDRLTLQLGLTALLLVLLSTTVSAVIVTRRSLAALGQSYREVETLTGNVLDAIDQAVVAVDADGNITIFNPTAEKWFGRTIAEIRGRKASTVLPVDFKLDQVRLTRTAETERETVAATSFGERILVHSTTPLITEDTAGVGAVTVIRDETESRAMTLQVRRAERLSAMGQLAAGVAHEIRNPLNAIALAAQQLKLELADDSGAPMADTIWAESKRLNLIVEDFLSLARPSNQPRAPVDLKDLIVSITQMARLEADKNNVELRLAAPEECTVNGVADELRKAFWNLLRNALVATPPGGSITIDLAVRETIATMTIDDTGSGIAPDALPRVFEPWFTTKPGGTGLGLAITHRIVQDHKGTIEVLSPVPGSDRGTRLIVRLPVAPQ